MLLNKLVIKVVYLTTLYEMKLHVQIQGVDGFNLLLGVTRDYPKNKAQKWTAEERNIRNILESNFKKLPFTTSKDSSLDRQIVRQKDYGPQNNIDVNRHYHAYSGAMAQDRFDQILEELRKGRVIVDYGISTGLGFNLPF